MDKYSSIKKDDIMPFVTKLMDLDTIMLSDIRAIFKESCEVFHLFHNKLPQDNLL